MKVITYMNDSHPSYVTKNLTQISEIDCLALGNISILKPTLTIETGLYTNVDTFNYFYIPNFGRYYFLTGESVMTKGMLTFSGVVDPLMSYASAIRNCYAIISRQENSYNLYLDDGMFKVYQNPNHKIQKFPNGFSDYSYIFAINGNGQTSV